MAKISIPGLIVKMSMEKAAGMTAENESLRADLKKLAVAATKVLYLHEHLKGEGYSKATAMDYLKQALDLPGVRAVLEGAKDG